MIKKVNNLKEIPYGTYRGYIVLNETVAEKLVNGGNAWLFQSNSPKALILYIEVPQILELWYN